jgi:hypothetical protein
MSAGYLSQRLRGVRIKCRGINLIGETKDLGRLVKRREKDQGAELLDDLCERVD